MANSPAELTVIYPLIELREDTISPLRSWTRDQTFARERYRVIAVFAEADRAQAEAMQPLLGPNDELLPVPERSFAAMLNAGIARAATPWLVMTEGHCIAQPGCLDQVMRWIETNPDDRIGNFEFTHFSHKTVNQLVGRWYERTVAQWRTPPDWERAISGGFAIRKSLLDEVGPLQPAFAAFSPHAQSALLHSRGIKVVNVPGAAVLHLDEGSMAEFYDSTERYMRGEFIARSQIDPVFMERYFGAPELWINRARLERGTALAMMRALIIAARTRPRRAAALAGAFASMLGSAAGGLRLRIALNRLWLAFYAMAIERLPMPDDTRFRQFLRSHQRAARLAQLEWLQENPVAPSAGLAEGRRAIDELGPGDIVGVYGLEEFGGRRFRWTEPVAMIRMAARQTACELRLETGGIRGDPPAFLIAVAIAGRRPAPQILHKRCQGNADHSSVGCLRCRRKGWRRAGMRRPGAGTRGNTGPASPRSARYIHRHQPAAMRRCRCPLLRNRPRTMGTSEPPSKFFPHGYDQAGKQDQRSMKRRAQSVSIFPRGWMAGKAALLAVTVLGVLAAPARSPAQDAGVSGIPPGPANARGLNGSVNDPSGIGNAARVPAIPPPAISPAMPSTVSPPTAFRTLPVQRGVKIKRTRFAAAKSRRGTKETREREDKAAVSEQDKLLDRKILSICRGC